jgi:Ca-activated chloride channel homolog
LNPNGLKTGLLKLVVALVVIGVNSSASYAGLAQEVQDAQHPLQAKTELVKLDVTVLDTQGDFVDGLEQKSFRVLDNGIERPIVFFAPVTSPAKIVVILETSPAVYLFQDEHLAAAYVLLNGLPNDDEVALVTYSDVPRSLVSFTTNKPELMTALTNIQYMVGVASLNLYDSVSAVIDGIAAFPGKKALVLLTTGLDSSAPDRFAILTQKLRKDDVVIFSVGLGGGSLQNGNAKKGKLPKKSSSAFDAADPVGTSTLERARQAVSEISAVTGGRAYFPETGEDFASAYREIAASVRHEYVLGIAPQHDGQLHRLSVEVADPQSSLRKTKHRQPEYRISAREGYTAPTP